MFLNFLFNFLNPVVLRQAGHLLLFYYKHFSLQLEQIIKSQDRHSYPSHTTKVQMQQTKSPSN